MGVIVTMLGKGQQRRDGSSKYIGQGKKL